MLNLASIKKKKDMLAEKQRSIYRKIYHNIVSLINHNAGNNIDFCLFEVPYFMLDEITYPMDECLRYLDAKLEDIKKDDNIIEITFYQPNVYYIKWKI